jgi:hypothetical protein
VKQSTTASGSADTYGINTNISYETHYKFNADSHTVGNYVKYDSRPAIFIKSKSESAFFTDNWSQLLEHSVTVQFCKILAAIRRLQLQSVR